MPLSPHRRPRRRPSQFCRCLPPSLSPLPLPPQCLRRPTPSPCLRPSHRRSLRCSPYLCRCPHTVPLAAAPSTAAVSPPLLPPPPLSCRSRRCPPHLCRCLRTAAPAATPPTSAAVSQPSLLLPPLPALPPSPHLRSHLHPLTAAVVFITSLSPPLLPPLPQPPHLRSRLRLPPSPLPLSLHRGTPPPTPAFAVGSIPSLPLSLPSPLMTSTDVGPRQAAPIESAPPPPYALWHRLVATALIVTTPTKTTRRRSRYQSHLSF